MSDYLKPIEGASNIAAYMKCSTSTFMARHAKPMKAAALLWKKDGRKAAKLVSTPFFITMYLYLQSLEQNEEKRFEALAGE